MYADANNCINTVEERYHRDIMDLRYPGSHCDLIYIIIKIDSRNKGGRPNGRLFSYVDSDGYKKPVTLVSALL